MMAGSSVLLIGGSGNLSTEVADELIRRGHSVYAVTTGRRPMPAGCAGFVADRNDRAAFEHAVQDFSFDIVINFLGFTPDQCAIDQAIFYGRISQYIFISSATVYQKPPARLPITEDTPLSNPFSEYAQKKIACEQFLTDTAVDFPTVIVRPSHTFGRTWIPCQLNGSSDFTIAARILAGKPIVVADDGQTLWTPTAASDFAVGVAGLCGKQNAIGQAFHITSDEVLTWNCIYEELGRALGRKPVLVYVPSGDLAKITPAIIDRLQGDKGQNAVFDNRKIKRFVPEFVCRKPFRDAIRESAAWYLADPARQIVSKEQDRLIEEWVAQI
jgi:nucleoside-diphosphate-sugar epimerase